MTSNNKICYCKVNEVISHYSDILEFKFGDCYRYRDEGVVSVSDSAFVFYDHKSVHGSGYRFYWKKNDRESLLFSDYFCTLKELRKLKIEKIENNDK